MPDGQRTLSAILDDIARNALASGDRPILNLVEEACELLGFDDHCPAGRAERDHGEEAPRHIVEVTAEGFQILDSWTEALRADVWSTREQARDACEELNGSASASNAS